jgi:hypothetical protein
MKRDVSETKIICILPVKNEAWILKHFIEAALAWADFIIIGDHNSIDGSASIALQYDRVKVIPLSNPSFDAGDRRAILLDEARKIPGKRIIFAIDADEMLSANWADSPEWDLILNAPPGTMFRIDWPYILPGLEQALMFGVEAIFVDDGTEYVGNIISEERIPITAGDIEYIRDIKLLHFVNIDPNRKSSKQRWYKCFETVEVGTRPWAACIKYPNNVSSSYGLPIVPVDEKWLSGFKWLADYKSVTEEVEQCYWWDEEVLNYFDRYGTGRFRKINIWDVDWNAKARSLLRRGNYNDPRSIFEVWVHKFIEKYWNELKIGQASENHLFWLGYMLGRVGLRIMGW